MKPSSNYVMSFFWNTMDATLCKRAVTGSTRGRILFYPYVNSPTTQYYLMHDSVPFGAILIIKPNQIYQNVLFHELQNFFYFLYKICSKPSSFAWWDCFALVMQTYRFRNVGRATISSACWTSGFYSVHPADKIRYSNFISLRSFPSKFFPVHYSPRLLRKLYRPVLDTDSEETHSKAFGTL